MTEYACAFAARYRGRHAPEDALFWLEHPDSPGPTGAPPVQWLFLAAADRLREAGHAAAADAMLLALADLLDVDRRAAQDALRALPGPDPAG